MIVFVVKEQLKGMYFSLPLDGRITSEFGPRESPVPGATEDHKGIDIEAKVDTPIYSKFPVKVISIFKTSTGGNQLIVEHNDGWRSGYAHLNRYGNIRVGETYNKGTLLAYTGNTGNVSGPHLHYTLTDKQGNKVDPLKYKGKKLV